MADGLELFEELKTNLYDLSRLFELANETWPELCALIKAKIQVHPNLIAAHWDLIAPNWPLLVGLIKDDVPNLFEEFQEATVDVDITDWNIMWRIYTDLRPQITDNIEVFVFQRCQNNTDINEDEAWEMLCDMWRAVTTRVKGELEKRGVAGRVELREMLKVLVLLLPELMRDGQRRLEEMKRVWQVVRKGDVDDWDIRELKTENKDLDGPEV